MPPPPPPAFIVRGDDGEEYGPVDLAELREWVRENRAGLGTVVRPDRPDASWQPWQNYPELVALLAAVPIYARQGWLVEDLLRDVGAPNGTAEALVDKAMRRFAEAGSRYATLGLAPSGEF